MIAKNRVANPNSARIEFNRQNCKITSLYLPFLLRHLSDGNYKKLLSICKDLLYRMAITFQKLFYNNFRIKTSTQSTATNAIHGLNNHGGHRGLCTGIFFFGYCPLATIIHFCHATKSLRFHFHIPGILLALLWHINVTVLRFVTKLSVKL